MARRPEMRPDLGLFEGYHSPQFDVDVRLNTNESPFPPPQAWRDELASALSRIDWHRYPDRAALALRGAIADLHGVDRNQVFAANGSNEVLQTVCLAYGGPGRSVAVFEPTYAMHSTIARITGATVAAGTRNPDFSIDLDEARRLLKDADPALTFLCSPNNPSGTVESRSTVEGVIAAAPGLVLVDEAYAQFSSWSALDLVDDEEALVVTRTFSKTWSMAAARLGYLIGPSWLVADLEKVALPYHLDAVKQIAGRLALTRVSEMEERVAVLVAERERITGAFGDLDVEWWPSGANFVLFRPRSISGDAVWNALVEKSILVRNCSSWPGLAGCLRVTVGTPEENTRFLDALGTVLRNEVRPEAALEGNT